MKKEVGEVIKAAEAAGFSIDRYTGSGHYKLTHGNGESMVIPSTPSGPRWKQNALADIKRAKRKDKRK